MKIVIIVEYIVNLLVLLFFYMHMFQLNSYFLKRYSHWMNTNKKKIMTQILLVAMPSILLIPRNNITNVIAIILFIISIIYNFPKGKSKIALKITNRVKRMLVTETILIVLTLIIGGIENYIYIKLAILNIVASIICIIANIINSPIEKVNQKRYINEAKKILRGMPNLIVIGVTGSYGKTSVKNFLAKTLSAKYEVLVTPKNYNTTMGVVKTIRENLKATNQIFICEMGATKLGDIKEICDLVNPKLGIITSIGPQHLESFKSIENVIKTKYELADAVKKNGGTVFLNYDNEYIAKQKNDFNKVSYGMNNRNLDYNAYNLVSSSKGLLFKILDKEKYEVEFKTKLIGSHNIVNITAAIAVANFLGVKLENLVPRINQIESVEHRLQLISRGNLTIIDDSYNANPVSSKSAIDTLGEFEGTKIVVTPGLIELGNEEEKYNFEFGEYITKVCDYVFLVGEKNSKTILEGILSKGYDKEKVHIVSSPEEAMSKISKLNISGKITVLLENDLPDNYN